jgi:hypothetical protein
VLASREGNPATVVWTSNLGGKQVDWALKSGAGNAHVLWALGPVEGGWCVLGTFLSADPVVAPMTMADRALSPAAALALVRFESVPDERTKVATRYVALATDGDHLWFALEGRGGHQLIANQAKFLTQGSTVFMEVPTPSKATAVLKFDGTRFVQLN